MRDICAFCHAPADQRFHIGILSACAGCDPDVSTVAYYVSWAAIDQAMNQHITLSEDQGIE